MANKFIFIGTIGKTKNRELFEHVTQTKTGKAVDIAKFNAMMRSGTNTEFVECVGFGGRDIKFRNDQKEDVTIPWADRNSKEALAQLPRARKFYADLGEEHGGPKEFPSSYDFAAYLGAELANFDARVRVSGYMTRRFYNGVSTNQFSVSSIRLAKENEADKMVISNDIYFTQDALDENDFSTAKMIHVSGYIMQYIDKDHGNMYVPMSFNLSAQGLDLKDTLIKKCFVAKRDSFKVPAGKVYHMAWISDVLNGVEEAQFDESMLTDFQKAMIEMGENTIDDFRPVGSVYGDRITDVRLAKMNATGQFANGVVDSEMTEDEFMAKIYTGPAQTQAEKPAAKNEPAKAAPDTDPEFDEEADDLFA